MIRGVSNCYVFKSRLQEYAQKEGYTTPVYHTIKEGPSHQPSFRSMVVVNDVKYDSLTGFLNRKASEQSAAEVALVELAKTGAMQVSQPVHETGLCKNLLQEYAQKMNFAIPSYDTKKDEKQGRDALFTSAVDIGGIKYIGGAARTKKQAELKAARTALLAIQSSGSESTQKSNVDSVYTVIPTKRKATDLDISAPETAQAVKPKKKSRFKKRQAKKRATQGGDTVEVEKMDANNEEAGTESNQTISSFAQGTDQKLDGGAGELSAAKGAPGIPCDTRDSDGHLNGLNFEQSDLGNELNEVSNVSGDGPTV